jgi:ferrochelatase
MNDNLTPAKRKTKIVFVQLGSPTEPTPRALRKFLKDFLGDPRVVDLNPYLWRVILNCFVLPLRPRKSAKLYQRIWDGHQFPLVSTTKRFTDKVRAKLKHLDPEGFVEVDHAFLLSKPYVSDVYDSWEQDVANGTGATKLLVIPLFPQYSESTIASGIDALGKEFKRRVKIPTFEVITNFHRSHAFIDSSVTKIDDAINRLRGDNIGIDSLVVSFHGMQKRRIVQKGDDYYRHCYETFRLIVDRLTSIPACNAVMCFQSRFGSEEWITPYTERVVEELVSAGKKNIAIYAPSFVTDCLETTDELGHELSLEVREWGGTLYTIDCLNADDQWCEDFAKFSLIQAEGSAQDREDIEYSLTQEAYSSMPKLEMKKH